MHKNTIKIMTSFRLMCGRFVNSNKKIVNQINVENALNNTRD